MALHWIKTCLECLRPWVQIFTGNHPPKVNAQDNGFVSKLQLKNVKTKKFTQNIKRKIGKNSGKYPSQNAGLAPQVDCSACGNGMFLADTYDGFEADEITYNITLENTS